MLITLCGKCPRREICMNKLQRHLQHTMCSVCRQRVYGKCPDSLTTHSTQLHIYLYHMYICGKVHTVCLANVQTNRYLNTVTTHKTAHISEHFHMYIYAYMEEYTQCVWRTSRQRGRREGASWRRLHKVYSPFLLWSCCWWWWQTLCQIWSWYYQENIESVKRSLYSEEGRIFVRSTISLSSLVPYHRCASVLG